MKKILYILALSLLVLLPSCRKSLCYDLYHPHGRQIRVIIDDTYMDYMPDQMRLDFYDGNGVHTVRYVTQSDNVIELTVGQYKAVVFNDNSESVNILGEDAYGQIGAWMPFISRSQYNSIYLGRAVPYSNISAGTAPLAPGPGSTLGLPRTPQAVTIGQPNLLFGDKCDMFEVTDDPSLQTDLCFTPRNITVVYHIMINLTGWQYVRQARGSMSGASYYKIFSTLERGPQAAEVMFDCFRDTGTDCLVTSVTAFGLVRCDAGDPDMAGMNEVTFEFLLINGDTYSETFDIRHLLDDNMCANGGVIDLTGMTIDIPAVEDGGFVANLEDWYDEETVPINLN